MTDFVRRLLAAFRVEAPPRPAVMSVPRGVRRRHYGRCLAEVKSTQHSRAKRWRHEAPMALDHLDTGDGALASPEDEPAPMDKIVGPRTPFGVR